MPEPSIVSVCEVSMRSHGDAHSGMRTDDSLHFNVVSDESDGVWIPQILGPENNQVTSGVVQLTLDQLSCELINAFSGDRESKSGVFFKFGSR